MRRRRESSITFGLDFVKIIEIVAAISAITCICFQEKIFLNKYFNSTDTVKKIYK